MSANFLAELKKLQHQRSDVSPFASHVEFLQWADNVSPRLSFDATLKSRFKRHVDTAKFKHNSGYSPIEQINEAIGTLNQAILSLETPEPIISKQTTLEPPQKVTLMWLYQHAPISFYVSLFGAVVLAFGLGRELGKFEPKIQSSNLSSAAPITIVPINEVKRRPWGQVFQ